MASSMRRAYRKNGKRPPDNAILAAIQRLERSQQEDKQALGLSLRMMITALRASASAN
jgi:hypothetical protein